MFIAFCYCVYFQRTCVDPAKEREGNPQNVFRRIPIFWRSKSKTLVILWLSKS